MRIVLWTGAKIPGVWHKQRNWLEESPIWVSQSAGFTSNDSSDEEVDDDAQTLFAKEQHMEAMEQLDGVILSGNKSIVCSDCLRVLENRARSNCSFCVLYCKQIITYFFAVLFSQSLWRHQFIYI